MKKKRLIPLVLYKSGYVIQSRDFSVHRSIGLLDATLRRLDDWHSDEVVLVDISPSWEAQVSSGRLDTASKFSATFLDAVRTQSHYGSMPLTIGGGISSMQQVEHLFLSGADKILLGSAIFDNPHLVTKIAKEYGSQSIVFSLDYREVNGRRQVCYAGAQKVVPQGLREVLEIAFDLGVGEVMLHAVTRDGSKLGMDLDVVTEVQDIKMPLIACGGAGSPAHMIDMLQSSAIDAVAAANYFHHVESSVHVARSALFEAGLPVRSAGSPKGEKN